MALIEEEARTAPTAPFVPAPMRRLAAPVRRPRSWLRLLLVGLDALGLVVAWVIGLVAVGRDVGPPLAPSLVCAVAVSGVGVFIAQSLDLYLARASAVRAVELSRVVKAMLLTGAAAIVGFRVVQVDFRLREIAVATALSTVFLLVTRSGFRAWIGHRRRDGHNVRDVVVVGAGSDAAELVHLLSDHTDTGLRVVGVLGRRADALEHGLSALWCGAAEDAAQLVRAKGATGAVIAVGSVEPRTVDAITRDLLAIGAHIHLSTGVRGIDSRRLRALPLAHEPLLYLEPVTLSRAQTVVKRAVDIVVSALLLLALSPLLGLIALLVRRHDGGAALFTQERVGQGGRAFRVYKFRSMVVDAEAAQAALAARNERLGPLFKMEIDPRVTPIGRFLRDSSLDELPQLLNVLRGEMSLVGPRPALPAEVATFDDRLLERNRVRPGITGLWQVEARDNPSFTAYRRLDLFYVDNWSLLLDLMITLATAEQVVARLLCLVHRRHQGATVLGPTVEAA